MSAKVEGPSLPDRDSVQQLQCVLIDMHSDKYTSAAGKAAGGKATGLLHSLLYVHIIPVLQGKRLMCEECPSLACMQTEVARLHASACSLRA